MRHIDTLIHIKEFESRQFCVFCARETMGDPWVLEALQSLYVNICNLGMHKNPSILKKHDKTRPVCCKDQIFIFQLRLRLINLLLHLLQVPLLDGRMPVLGLCRPLVQQPTMKRCLKHFQHNWSPPSHLHYIRVFPEMGVPDNHPFSWHFP